MKYIVSNSNKRIIVLSWAVLLLLIYRQSYAVSQETEKPKENISSVNVTITKKIVLPKGYHEGLLFHDNKILVCNGRGLGTWIVDPQEGKIDREIEPFRTFTEGITYADDNVFWLTDWEEKKLHKINIEGNKISSSFEVSLAPAHPTGVIYVDGKIYVITWTRGSGGTKYHVVQFNGNGEMLQKRQLYGISEPSQITWDGKDLWITSWYSQKVFKVNINTLKIMNYFKAPAKKTTGITWNKGYFWITGTYDDLYQVEIDNRPQTTNNRQQTTDDRL